MSATHEDPPQKPEGLTIGVRPCWDPETLDKKLLKFKLRRAMWHVVKEVTAQ